MKSRGPSSDRLKTNCIGRQMAMADLDAGTLGEIKRHADAELFLLPTRWSGS